MTKNNPPDSPRPPRLAQWLLMLSVSWKFKEEIENDLEELFLIRVKNWGVKRARQQYWRDVLSIWFRRSWFEEFQFTHLNTFAMFKNYMKVTLRNLKKQKIYSFINVFGLSVGLAFCALIFLYVQDELNYDKFHENKDRIYRVETTYFNASGETTNSSRNNSIPLGPALKDELAGVQDFVRIFDHPHYIKSDSDPIEETVMYADPSIFTIFSFPLKWGDHETALQGLNSVVLSEQAAKKYFGDQNPIGKMLQIRKDEEYEEMQVTGVLQPIPHNSTIRFDILLNIKGDGYYTPRFMDRWSMNLYRTYILLNDGTTAAEMTNGLDSFFDKYHEDYLSFLREREGFSENIRPASYRLNPLPDIHMNYSSDPKYSFILSGIALAILLIACINFMTLSIGRSSRRSREIGLRKVIGAFRHQLMFQFWGEAFVISFISLLFGLLLAGTFLPLFNGLSGKILEFHYIKNWEMLLGLTGLVLLTGLIAGSYPAIVLSNIKPVASLKGILKINGSNAFTKSLVVLQFSLSVLLIIGTLVMKNQLDYIQSRDLGYNKDHVVVIKLNHIDGAELSKKFRNAIGHHTDITDITGSGYFLGMDGSIGYGVEHNGKKITLNVFTIESNYFNFLDLDIVAGRKLSANLASDSTEAIVVNETLVRELEITDPIGKEIPDFDAAENTHGGAVIVGIVEDHIFQALYHEMQPAFFTLNPAWGMSTLMIRVNPEHTQESIALIRETWNQLVPHIPFSYTFLDDALLRNYQEDQRWAKIINYSSWFAILIACMGLFGLVTLTVTSRKKEIGIRKVLGASLSGITTLFAKDFIKLVAIGILIASPVAYYFMNQWLTHFAYRIPVSWLHFLIAGGLVLLVAIITISVQTMRAGLENPAETLANE